MYVLCLLPASVGTYRTLPWRMFRGFQFLGINYTKLEYFWEGGRRWRMRMIICVHVRVRVHVCVHVFTYRYLSSTWLSATRENWVMHRRRDEWKHANKYICVCVCVCVCVLCAMCCVLCAVCCVLYLPSPWGRWRRDVPLPWRSTISWYHSCLWHVPWSSIYSGQGGFEGVGGHRRIKGDQWECGRISCKVFPRKEKIRQGKSMRSRDVREVWGAGKEDTTQKNRHNTIMWRKTCSQLRICTKSNHSKNLSVRTYLLE